MFATLRLLRENPEFAKLWLAQVISLTGDWFNTVVLSALVADYSDGSGLAVSIFLMARFLPPLFVIPIAGVFVDRFNRKHLLIGSTVLRAFIVPLFLLANSPDLLWLIYAVTIIQFVVSSIFEPGQSAIIPALTRSDDLVEANTLVSITWSVMLALGAVLGGVFAFVFGIEAALLADALTFLIAGYLLYLIKYDPVKGRKLAKEAGVDGFGIGDGNDDDEEDTSFMEGLRYIRQSPQMLAALFIKFGISIGNVDTLMTIFATQIFVLGATGELSLGIMYSVFGVGAFIGPIMTNRINDGSVSRMRRLVIIGFVAIVLGWLILGVSFVFAVACLAIFVRALGGSINWTYSTIIIQKTAPDAKLGRMFAVDFAGFQIATVVSTLIHGALIDAVGPDHVRTIALWTAVVSIVPLLFWLWVLPRVEQHETQQEAHNTNTMPVAGD